MAIIGAGYVGMPLARVFADAGKVVLLVDVDREVVDGINRGASHIPDVSSGGGRRGIHSPHFGFVLAEMQVLARQHPGATW